MIVPHKPLDIRHQEIECFFDGYSKQVNRLLSGETSDIDRTVKSFASCLMEVNPIGISCTKNDKNFRDAIPEGYQLYKFIGITAREIISKQIEILDEYHTMAKVHWRSSFVKVDSTLGEIEFDVTYFLRKEEESHKIFMCITGEEKKALKANELI